MRERERVDVRVKYDGTSIILADFRFLTQTVQAIALNLDFVGPARRQPVSFLSAGMFSVLIVILRSHSPLNDRRVYRLTIPT